MVHDLAEAEQRVQRERPRFYAALMALGKNDAERARALNVQRLTVRAYRLGVFAPRHLLDRRARQSGDTEVVRARAMLMHLYSLDEQDELQAA